MSRLWWNRLYTASHVKKILSGECNTFRVFSLKISIVINYWRYKCSMIKKNFIDMSPVVALSVAKYFWLV